MQFGRHNCTNEVLSKLIDLVQTTIQQRDDQIGALDRLSRKMDGIGTLVVQMEKKIMGQFDVLTEKVTKLETEVGEIVAFVHSEAGKLAALMAENVALTARIAELEPNQITPEDRAALAANEAKIQASIDSLNQFTPDAIPPVEPPVEPPA